MKNFLKQHGLWVLFAAAVLSVALAVMSVLSANSSPLVNLTGILVSPFRAGYTAVAAWFNDLQNYYKDTTDLLAENAALRQQIELAQKKKSKLLGYNAAGQLSDRDFLSMNRDCEREINEAEWQIYELEQQQLSKAEFKKHIDTIRRVLREAKRDAAQGIINKEFVDKYIDKIFVTPEDGRLKLQIKIFTGDTTDKYLANLRSRTGHTFKKMIEAYENGMK